MHNSLGGGGGRGHSSLDSMGSLQNSETASVGLFGASDWGLAAAAAAAHTSGGGGGGSGDVDGASMEKLLGLLPSDLLHS